MPETNENNSSSSSIPPTTPPVVTKATAPQNPPKTTSNSVVASTTDTNPVQATNPIAITDPKKNDPALAPKQQMTIGLLFGLIILTIIIIIVIRPIVNDIGQTKSEIETAQGQLEQLDRKKQQIAMAQTNYQALADRLPMIDEAMPNYSNVPLVAGIFERLAADIILPGGGALLVQRINFTQMPNDKPEALATGPGTANLTTASGIKMSAEVPVTITLTGDYQSIRDYIVQLRGLRHNFYVERLTFFAPTGDSNFLDANINLKYYYFE